MGHTPGPWSVEPESVTAATGHYEPPVILAADGFTSVAIIRVGAGHDEANARLIAAAPDLLRAAKDAQCACPLGERDLGHRVDCWMPALSSAIAKAEKE